MNHGNWIDDHDGFPFLFLFHLDAIQTDMLDRAQLFLPVGWPYEDSPSLMKLDSFSFLMIM